MDMQVVETPVQDFCREMLEVRRWWFDRYEKSSTTLRLDMLLILGGSEDCRMGYAELEQTLGRATRTIHYLVLALTAEGLCEVKMHGPDRRFRVVVLTAKGIEALRELQLEMSKRLQN
jgi:DNA-binding MarR family transcriptional regulator